MPHLLLHQQLQHQPFPLFHHHLSHTKTRGGSCLLNPTRTSTAMMVVIPPIKTHNLFQQKTMTRTVKCMANPRRVKMVAMQIQREISDMLITDKVLQYAVLPEAALGADRYLSCLTTVSDVEVSPDLQMVKVYVSFFGDERGKEVALAGLKSKAKYVRTQLGRRMKLRLTPEVRFIEDESQERGSRVIAILDKIKNEKKKTVEGEDEEQSSDQPEDDMDYDDDDDDDDEEEEDEDTDVDIIYVK